MQKPIIFQDLGLANFDEPMSLYWQHLPNKASFDGLFKRLRIVATRNAQGLAAL